jgi:glycosyltransferase involved in cell wall biosynthesis
LRHRRLENTIGGEGDAQYEKHHINWRGQILSMNLRRLKGTLGESKANVVCIDVVVPSFRINNNEFLERILLLRASKRMYGKFWLVLDNPSTDHVQEVKKRVARVNEEHSLGHDGCNYFCNVIYYASYARNTGFNYTTADWVLFLNDDVIPDSNILDSYMGIMRYPDAKVFVGLTELPDDCNTWWTLCMRACNVGYFYSIATRMAHPSWGVTANLLVRGSRHNLTIQFKEVFPKAGGGEDIDFVYQFKQWYGKTHGRVVTAGVSEAIVKHPWWNQGYMCYKQIMGWVWGDSLCITEWSSKTFTACPNWIEYVALCLPPLSLYTGQWRSGFVTGVGVILIEHILKAMHYFPEARRVTHGGFWKSVGVALGAGSILSSQEVTRLVALFFRGSAYSICRRVDWFDGEEPRIKLDIQLSSLFRFAFNAALTWVAFRRVDEKPIFM